MAGSAVGLGNAWKFPTMVGQNGGSAFILLYFALTMFVAFVVFLAELGIGRLSRRDPVSAYEYLAPKNKKLWGFAGFFMSTAVLISCFYLVVLGWIVKYIYLSVFPLPSSIETSGAIFGSLLSNDLLSQFICFSIVFFITFYTVSKGIINGIEKMNVWMMPALIILLFLMLLYSAFVDGFGSAFSFMFMPDFSKLGSDSVLKALGLSFFSLSLGVCTVLTYAASLPDKINVLKSTLSIIFINILIGLMMGLIIFTFIFAYGADPAQQGPGLIFVSLASLFGKLGLLGNVLAFAFFISLLFAGLTSSVSMIEPFCTYLVDRFKLSRNSSLIILGVFVYIFGSFCILGFNESTAATFSLFKLSAFDILDYITSNILMPLAALVICSFVGFVIKRDKLEELLSPYLGSLGYKLWLFFLRFIAPLAILAIMINQLFYA